jgi:hypothetical protein
VAGLARFQRNQIFELLLASGLHLAEFDLEDRLAGLTITHRPTESRFSSSGQQSRGIRLVEFRIGDDPPLEFTGDTWSDILEALQQLADGVVYIVNTPDRWAEMSRARELVSLEDHADNSEFTPDEQALISARIKEIKDYIRETYELTGETLARLEARLDAVVEDSHRFGRKDWINSLLGAAFGLVLQDVVPLQAATHIVVMAVTGLGHLFGIGGLSPSLPPS